MAKRTDSQKKGSRGERLVLYQIEKHPQWLSRALDEDFGIDCEAELTEPEVRGELLKIQVKSSGTVPRRNGCVEFEVEKKYVDYCRTCRTPLVLVRVDLAEEKAWTLWLQDWVLRKRSQGQDFSTAGPWTVWVPEGETLQTGLDGPLKDIARWRHPSQLVLGVLDALRAAAASANKVALGALVDLVAGVHTGAPPWAMDLVIEEAVELGQRLRATAEGNSISGTLFDLIQRFGDATSSDMIERIVLRGEDTYSRTGVSGLGLLYDHHREHVQGMALPKRFLERGRPHVAWYCAWREAHPGKLGLELDMDPPPRAFQFAGLHFAPPEDLFFGNKYANRGPSAILDYLVETEP